MKNAELDQQVEEMIDGMYARMYAKIEDDKEARELFDKMPLSYASVASMAQVFTDVMEKKPAWNTILYSLMRLRCTVLDREGQDFCTAWFEKEREEAKFKEMGGEMDDTEKHF